MDKNTWEEEIKNEFTWFHQHPELAHEEYETTKRIQEKLQAAGIDIIDTGLQTGLVAKIQGQTAGPVIALRCDIDALPITEETELSYKSKNIGKMHACGHDFHIAAVLGTALLLQKQELAGTVKVIFQPAEETLCGGADDVIATRVLDDVEAIFGIHSSSLLPVGTIGLRSGAVTAAVDQFHIRYKGQGTHAAHPDKGIDPIVALAAFVTAAQSIVSRNMDPFSPVIVSITHIEGGNSWNIIPDDGFVEGTVRTLGARDREYVKKRLYEVAQEIAKAYGVCAEIKWISGPPATNNDPKWISFAENIALGQKLQVTASPLSLAGEDFAFYQEKISGAFFQIGTGLSFANHNPKFEIDTAAIGSTVEFLAEVSKQALSLLAHKK